LDSLCGLSDQVRAQTAGRSCHGRRWSQSLLCRTKGLGILNEPILVSLWHLQAISGRAASFILELVTRIGWLVTYSSSPEDHHYVLYYVKSQPKLSGKIMPWRPIHRDFYEMNIVSKWRCFFAVNFGLLSKIFDQTPFNQLGAETPNISFLSAVYFLDSMDSSTFPLNHMDQLCTVVASTSWRGPQTSTLSRGASAKATTALTSIDYAQMYDAGVAIRGQTLAILPILAKVTCGFSTPIGFVWTISPTQRFPAKIATLVLGCVYQIPLSGLPRMSILAINLETDVLAGL
jgi:hypothetical protein